MSNIPSEIENVLTDCAKAILPQVYTDLAQPGVKAVGQALGTVLELSSTILLPVKLLNEKAKLLFAKGLNKYKEKLESIPEEKRTEVAPDIGTPILDKLTCTQSEDIADLFTNLLANASNVDRVNFVHPSFASMVGRLSPDEARILNAMKNSNDILYCDFDGDNGGAYTPILNHITAIQKYVALQYPQNELAYLSNLESMGVLKDNFPKEKTDVHLYQEIADFHNVNQLLKEKGASRYKNVTVSNGFCSVTPFGRMFIEACTRA